MFSPLHFMLYRGKSISFGTVYINNDDDRDDDYLLGLIHSGWLDLYKFTV